MFCQNCGQYIQDGTAVCPHCQAVQQNAPNPQQPVYTQPPVYTQTPVYTQSPYTQPPIPKPSVTWLVINIVLTVLSGCSNILAIIGIVFGALAQSNYTKRNYAEAESNSKTCRILGIVSVSLFGVALLLVILYVVLIFAGLGIEYYM